MNSDDVLSLAVYLSAIIIPIYFISTLSQTPGEWVGPVLAGVSIGIGTSGLILFILGKIVL